MTALSVDARNRREALRRVEPYLAIDVATPCAPATTRDLVERWAMPRDAAGRPAPTPPELAAACEVCSGARQTHLDPDGDGVCARCAPPGAVRFAKGPGR